MTEQASERETVAGVLVVISSTFMLFMPGLLLSTLLPPSPPLPSPPPFSVSSSHVHLPPILSYHQRHNFVDTPAGLGVEKEVQRLKQALATLDPELSNHLGERGERRGGREVGRVGG